MKTVFIAVAVLIGLAAPAQADKKSCEDAYDRLPGTVKRGDSLSYTFDEFMEVAEEGAISRKALKECHHLLPQYHRLRLFQDRRLVHVRWEYQT